ncbi:hypothetical protein [Lysobacter sp. FW306-1B-D06B]|uniref:hypothetical protein n=1 Tax=Lysobacter sp. FW306-1B-D06B TaxID=3140250 RepID=UPI003140AFDC
MRHPMPVASLGREPMLVRTALIAAVALAMTAPASARAAGKYTCDPSVPPEALIAGFTGELDRLYANYKSSEAAHQARLDAAGQARLDSGAWNAQDKAAFYARLAQAPAFLEQERAKKDATAGYMRAVELAFTSAQADPSGACGHANTAVRLLGELAVASQAQWVFMTRELEALGTRAGATDAD